MQHRSGQTRRHVYRKTNLAELLVHISVLLLAIPFSEECKQIRHC